MMNIQNKKQWNEAFFNACSGGHLEDVRHLCQKPYVDDGFSNIHMSHEAGLREACMKGHLDIVKYLLTSRDLIEAGHTFADLHAWDEEGFYQACSQGHIHVVKYLLTSKDLIEAGHTFADLHANDEDGFRGACAYGHLEVVKFLLTSSELIEAGHTFVDPHAENDHGFYFACSNKHWNVVRWLVMDYGIEKTQAIEKMIQGYPQVQDYFRAREELKDIQTTLENSNPKPYPSSIETHDSDRRATQKAKKL